MNYLEISKFKNKSVWFKNVTTKRNFGDVWLKGHITAVMSHLTAIDGVPYSNEGLEVREIKNG